MRPVTSICAVAALLPALPPVLADDMRDLAKLVRAPRKEPTYAAKRPLSGLAAFGPKADKAVWMVLDKTSPDAKQYDVLHIDLDADGDLTGPGERLTADSDGRFRLQDFTDPATGVAHGEL